MSGRIVPQKNKTGMKICPVCHGKLEAVGRIKFCFNCGADLRTEGERLMPHIEGVIKNISAFYPANLRDEAIQTLRKALELLSQD